MNVTRFQGEPKVILSVTITEYNTKLVFKSRIKCRSYSVSV